MTRNVAVPFVGVIAVLFTIGAVMGASAEGGLERSTGRGEDSASDQASFLGEVLDLTCYVAHPESGVGNGHALCARTCIEKGLPVGLLIGETIYIPIMKEHGTPNEAMAAYAGQAVIVRGTVMGVQGSHFILVRDVRPVEGQGE